MSSSNTSSDEKKAQVKEYFGRTAASYVTSPSHRTGSDLQRLLALGEFAKDQQALDIATGGGHTALAVAPHVAKITVSDLTPQMLKAAEGFLLSQGVDNAEFHIADAEQLPFGENSFDRVTCRIAPHHFPNVGKAVHEVARVLKPGGLFLVIDSCVPEEAELDLFINKVEKWRDPSHGRSHKVSEWQHFFAEAGLQVETQELFRRTHGYDAWTERSQMSDENRLALAKFMLNSSEQTREYFAVTRKADGHLDHFSGDYFLLKGRKSEQV
ncbi:MAG TPA: methyltransferase domain-containing protein [Ktedonobacteraceae bacterium]|nr:methyltransferase domain-containing protein [Ktedonobacteraceae bacterium]